MIKYWEVGLGPTDKNKWKGLNKLGKILMKVRENINK